MRIAIVHDDLTQWGGAERVLLGISELFPEAPLFTLVFDESNVLLNQNFKNKKVITTYLQKIPGWKKYFKATLPIHPLAFEAFDFTDFDLVISHTTRFANAIITKPETIHICYCHTPPRFLWNFSGEKVSSILTPYFNFLRNFDHVSSQRVDYWLAGSENAQARIKQIYNQESDVLLPFIDTKRFTKVATIDGDFYLIIARLNNYKRVDLAINAFNKLNKPLKVIGNGPKMKSLKSLAHKNIEFLGSVSENNLIEMLANCKALIVTAEEDFGLTPLEAQALGKPVIAYGKGGVLETVIEGKTGIFFPEQEVSSLVKAINKFEKMKFQKSEIVKHASKFSKEEFQKQLLNFISKASLRVSKASLRVSKASLREKAKLP